MLPNMDDVPNTINELNMHDPSMLPTANAALPWRAAEILTTSSGKEVPSDNAVIDTMPGGTPKSVLASITE